MHVLQREVVEGEVVAAVELHPAHEVLQRGLVRRVLVYPGVSFLEYGTVTYLRRYLELSVRN